ncbi:MAG: extracellular solute-binding protein [Acidimicrobiia bacterium]
MHARHLVGLRPPPIAALLLAVVIVAGACSSAGDAGGDDDPGDCTEVAMAVSPEKSDLMARLADDFNGSERAETDAGCVFVQSRSKSSGLAAQLLSTDWDEQAEGPRPVVWSPAASSWGPVVNQRLNRAGGTAIVGKGDPFLLTPLVIAMPEPMAQALGYPGTPVGWADILRLATSTEGWAAFGHPEWGAFKLGKTNPNFSTSGLNALIAQAYAATGKSTGLSSEDLDQPDVATFAAGVESAVVHYGDTTLTFLNNLYRADQRGAGLTYVSAVAVEEKSVIDFNQGNPDGVLQAGERPRPPRNRLVAVYPKEGTLFSDSPLFVLDAPWISDAQRQGAQRFVEFVKEPSNQAQVLAFNFRPGNAAVPIADPITVANGVDPAQPQTLFEVPSAPVLDELLTDWSSQRKKARVQLVLDVSGSMGEPADAGRPELGTKLDLAKQAAVDSLALFSPDDEVALTIFSTDLGPTGDQPSIELQPLSRVGDVAEELRTKLRDLVPTNGTPLYDVTRTAYEAAVAGYDPARINAVVLLTDGRNDDGRVDDDQAQFDSLLASLRSGSEGQATKPVRVFPIAYGSDADPEVLDQIAEAASSTSYSATDPRTINRVLAAVISNF